jgi:2-desacetyl-2-hydroxyethyl bacteriochlorophyllide A dehydrogenase
LADAVKRHSLYFTGPGQVEVREEALAAPSGDQLLVASRCSAISAGTELLVYRDQLPPALPLDETIGALRGSAVYPLKYGYALVGTVIAAGPTADRRWLGQTVFSFQPHTSHLLARADELIAIDRPAEEAVFLPNLETAVNLLLDAAPLIGEEVVLFGQGIVGLLTTALLARLPLAGLTTFDPLPARRELGRQFGATASLDPHERAGLEALAARFGYLPAGGADLVIELSGQPAALDQALALTGYSGRLVVASWYGRKPVSLDLGGRFHRSKIQIIASQVSRLAPGLSGRWTTARRLAVVQHLLPKLAPARLISHRFRLDEAATAYHLIDQRPAEAMQVIFDYV